MKKTTWNGSVLSYGELVWFEASFNSVARTSTNVKRFPVKMFAVLFPCRLLIKTPLENGDTFPFHSPL